MPKNDDTVSVADAVHGAMDDMSGAERRVARALLADYPTAGLATVSALATAASTSTATVVRFTARLGYRRFAELQDALRAELSRGGTSPVSRAAAGGVSPDGLAGSLAHRADLLHEAARTVPEAEWERFVKLVADDRHTLVLAGGRLSHLAARYLQLQLRHVRARTSFLADPLRSDLGALLDLHRGDVVVLFDFRRYEIATAELARIAHDRGAVVVLVTDVWLSPVARSADVVLPLPVEASILDSLAPAFALAEALLPAVRAQLGKRALDRMAAVEALRGPALSS